MVGVVAYNSVFRGSMCIFWRLLIQMQRNEVERRVDWVWFGFTHFQPRRVADTLFRYLPYRLGPVNARGTPIT